MDVVPLNPTEEELREVAIKRINLKKGFLIHLAVYIVVNLFFFILAMMWDSGDWNYLVLGGWGIGIAANAIDTYTQLNYTLSSKAIQKEMDVVRIQTGK